MKAKQFVIDKFPHAKLVRRNKDTNFSTYLYYISNEGNKISNNAEKPLYAWHSAMAKIINNEII